MHHERTLKIILPFGQGDVILSHLSDRVNDDGHTFTAVLDNGRDATDCVVEVVREGGSDDEDSYYEDDEDDEDEGTLSGPLPPMPDPAPLPGESEHDAFHRRSMLPPGSPLCATCNGENT